jgi:FMN-dependent NADH-azoreductase
MPRLLHIQSSPNPMSSVSRSLTDTFVETWLANHAGFEVDTLDLVAEPLPHFGPDALGGIFGPPEIHTPEMKAAAELSDRLCTQLEEAQVVVIGAPMINFTIPTQLKSWFDYVTVAGRTFEYSGPGQARGLLFGKRVFIVAAKGGDYADPPISSFDFQEPLLRMLLMFLGMFDVTFIRAEGTRMYEDEAETITAHARDLAVQLAS